MNTLHRYTETNRNAFAVVAAFLIVIFVVAFMVRGTACALRDAIQTRNQSDPIAQEFYK